jgi:hypothetical protein
MILQYGNQPPAATIVADQDQLQHHIKPAQEINNRLISKP